MRFSFLPTQGSKVVMEAMSRYTNMARAKKLVWQHMDKVLNAAGFLMATRARANLTGGADDSAAPMDSIRFTSRVLRHTAKGQDSTAPLMDTHDMQLALSWHAIRTPKVRTIIFGPIGTTVSSKKYGLKTISLNERVKRIGPGFNSVQNMQDLAWAHELGYSFTPSDATVRLFKGVAGEAKRDGDMERAKGAGYLAQQFHNLVGVSVTVPARKFMLPAVQSVQRELRLAAPGVARAIFQNWIVPSAKITRGIDAADRSRRSLIESTMSQFSLTGGLNALMKEAGLTARGAVGFAGSVKRMSVASHFAVRGRRK